jgi:predicted O-linked N-acetylglucosamine transferase (SPINDLY family)
MPTIAEALDIALEHHRGGRVAAAEHIYREILAAQPDEPNALNLLGVIANDSGRHDLALNYLHRAIDRDGTQAVFHNNLGNVLRDLGRPKEAIDCYRRALELQPRYAKALYNLAIVLTAQGEFIEGIQVCRQATAFLPHDAEAHNHLARAFQAAGRLAEAIACYHQAVQLKPDYAEAYHHLGNALRNQGRPREAIECYRRVLELKPELAEAHCNLGIARKDLGELDEAAACYRRALALKPDHAQTVGYLGNALLAQGKLDEALACHERALLLSLCDAVSHNNLSVALKNQGRLDESIESCKKALELDPELIEAHANWLYTMHFSPAYDAQAIFAEHRRWNAKFAAPLAGQICPRGNDRSPERRLRVGYVSPDFRLHPVGRFILPLLETHDHDRFEIFAYSSVRIADDFTERCRKSVDVWRDAVTWSDEELAEAVRAEKIDILVDLTMHLDRNRLLAFARKPAPVQVTYLAYSGTTGLDTMDYRLTDPYLDPPGEVQAGEGQAIYMERSVHLPESYWCYRPAIETPPPSSVPADVKGHITFGCLNNFCKITEPTLAAWSRILRAVESSRLLLHAFHGGHRERVRSYFERQGVARHRVEFVDFLPLAEFYDIHKQIDMALDPFPYGGGTTTCDALWMGVPVVSLIGRTAVGRGGLSILSNIGLAHLAAGDVDGYVEAATRLAFDRARLGELRRTLRDRMRHSPLMDAVRFARNVEACYRGMWREFVRS